MLALNGPPYNSGGKPVGIKHVGRGIACIKGLRITVYDVRVGLAGMTPLSRRRERALPPPAAAV